MLFIFSRPKCECETNKIENIIETESESENHKISKANEKNLRT